MKAAVVSAAASGIGSATVSTLIADGWDVVAVDVDEARLAQSPATIRVVGDARDGSTWIRAAEALESFGELQYAGLVSGVGGAIFRPSRDMSDDDWLGVLDLNLLATVRAVRAVLPVLERAGAGSIVTIGSMSGRRSEVTTPAYCAAKAALESWSTTLALELAATTVRVNCVLPGVTDTEGLRNNLQRKGASLADLAARESQQPRGTFIQPSEIATTVAFLLSPAASGLVGASVIVDGGMSLRLPG